jgi:small-conductance mechanosensitive channel
MTRGWARVNQDIQVVYGTDLGLAAEVVDGVGKALAADPVWGPRILEAPRFERISELGERGITLKIRGTVRASEQWSVGGELLSRLLKAFAERGVEMPHSA